MRTLSSVLIQPAPKRRERSDDSTSLDAILRSFLEEGPRWRSRARPAGGKLRHPNAESESRDPRSPR